MEAGCSFTSDLPDLQLALPRAGREAGLAASCTLNPSTASQREHKARASSGQHEGKVQLECRFCSEQTSARCRINSDFLHHCSLETPKHGSHCRKIFLVLSARDSLDCCQGGRCYPGPFVHVLALMWPLLLGCCPDGLRTETWATGHGTQESVGFLGTLGFIHETPTPTYSNPRAREAPGEEERAGRFQAGV